MTNPPDSQPQPQQPRSWTKTLTRVVWAVAGVYVIVFGLAALVTAWSASPKMCASCHEIAPAVATWQTSPHAKVGCPKCHEPVRPWGQPVQSLVWRASVLKRDVDAHRANPKASSLTTAQANSRPVPDENCLQCHDLAREVTLPVGLTMDHAKHIKRNKSCVSCHANSAHPAPDSEKPILLMQQCFACHGRQVGAKAPGTCSLCHTPAFSMVPKSHEATAAWLAGHGKVAKADRQPCAMCHDPSFCDACHRIPMPHPVGWAKGKPVPLHAAYAKKNTRVCVQCHGAAPNLCTMCHHKGFANDKSPWATHHEPTVSKLGASFCMTCHDTLFCFDCHSKQSGANAP